MNPWAKYLSIMLAIIAAFGVFNSTQTNLFVLKTDATVVTSSVNLLLVFVVFAAFIERACEVSVNILTSAGVVPPEDTSANAPAQSSRKIVAALICLVFAVGVSLAGLRLIEMVLTYAAQESDNVKFKNYFTMVDVLITSLILAGGSDGIHKIVRAIEGPPKDNSSQKQPNAQQQGG